MQKLIELYQSAVDKMHCFFTPLLLLFTRVWVSWIFLKSGYLKLTTWDSTLYLFEEEYQVPLVPWELAAYLGTAAELILPIFVILGLFTRPMAFALFMVNVTAVVSYSEIWDGGFYDHQLWGAMLLMNIVWGAGKLSADHVLKKRLL